MTNHGTPSGITHIHQASNWLYLTSDQRGELITICDQQGHDYLYIQGTEYRWDCARCNWQEHRGKPTLPLTPSMPYPRWKLIDQWTMVPLPTTGDMP